MSVAILFAHGSLLRAKNRKPRIHGLPVNMRITGLEPAPPVRLEPKSSASANSAISAISFAQQYYYILTAVATAFQMKA